MKSAISTLIGSTLIATTFVGFSVVDAQALDCGLSDITLEGINYTACGGQFGGNDTGNKGTLEGYLNDGTVFGSYGFSSDWSLNGKSDGDGGSFGFQADNGSTDATWSLTKNLDQLFGNDLTATFAVSFKSSTGYSVYLFENFQISQAQLDSGRLDGTFTTDGVSVNKKGKAQGLSHGSFWAYDGGEEPYNPPNEVPEPSAAAALGLLAAGMFGMKRRSSK
ncbi:MAG: PEP-CTERM sorting domain-containing protein [Roseofilum sp. SBFL]|uniref:PEP-CTERM sorting domain-containing protein n=1 Tax=unclassified Roseofilum TaxID=2620099 RepID=UPI001B19F663|nr:MULTISPECIES: PEP-CTERM sorting domain-containing protein [unclassified Roseofilum]MBP0012911.1 PEP-CTERM sorting domain-containing protein [Roseofilum sp. SID3]MBP0026574.1 PEP-CTERM sorting domain-containing protein [Roseofilum sp. SID2]MBP0037375.1 PEP-CTERM sorting domain-containing protein [Roseofilum sp. SID1]MBP0040752.1 PEP-CTERM sorting domain-containing protein [Roseofilum sp. SBFL]